MSHLEVIPGKLMDVPSWGHNMEPIITIWCRVCHAGYQATAGGPGGAAGDSVAEAVYPGAAGDVARGAVARLGAQQDDDAQAAARAAEREPDRAESGDECLQPRPGVDGARRAGAVEQRSQAARAAGAEGARALDRGDGDPRSAGGGHDADTR